jgi:nucleoside 2-deoxyribosyltransferase
MKKLIYLAGGFRSNWQQEVRFVLEKSYTILDPSLHGLSDPEEYTKWDLEAIRKSNIVLANMEATNSGGYALGLEIGYAKALGKLIIFVDQIKDERVSRYFEMVRQCSDFVFHDLKDAINLLEPKENDQSGIDR